MLLQRLELPLAAGGALSLHGGVAFGLHAAHFVADGPWAGWSALPAVRLHAGVEVDLDARVRLVGTVRYDPDHWNTLTQTPALGVDAGVLLRLHGDLAAQLHLQPHFVGLFWRSGARPA